MRDKGLSYEAVSNLSVRQHHGNAISKVIDRSLKD